MTIRLAQKTQRTLLNLVFWIHSPKNTAKFLAKAGYVPNICLPNSVEEKFLWRKIFDRSPQFTLFSDKLAVKDYVASEHPKVRYAKVFWRGDDIRQAPRELLRGPGFLKANHSYNTNYKLGPQADIDRLIPMTRKWLRRRHYRKAGEWAYKNVRPTLFIEEDLASKGTGPLVDFSVYVFGEQVTDFSVMLDHKTDRCRFARFNSAGRRSGPEYEVSTEKFRPLSRDFELPVDAATICDLAIRIAGGSDHLRIDLMWNGRALYFGEITVYSNKGFFPNAKNKPLLRKMTGSWDLRRSWFLSTPQTGWRARYARWLRNALETTGP